MKLYFLQLRRAERHIAHAEKRSVEDISPFGPGGFSIPVDRVPSYSIPSEISDPPAVSLVLTGLIHSLPLIHSFIAI